MEPIMNMIDAMVPLLSDAMTPLSGLSHGFAVAKVVELVRDKFRELNSAVVSINEQHFIEKTKTLCEEYNAEVDRSKVIAMQVESDYKSSVPREILIKNVVLTMNRLDDEIKAGWIGRLFHAWEKRWISDTQFNDLLKIIERWFLTDEETLDGFRIRHLHFVDDRNRSIGYRIEWHRMGRLASLGVIEEQPPLEKDGYTLNQYVFSPESRYQINMLGNIMLRLIKDESLESDWWKMARGSGVLHLQNVARSIPELPGNVAALATDSSTKNSVPPHLSEQMQSIINEQSQMK